MVNIVTRVIDAIFGGVRSGVLVVELPQRFDPRLEDEESIRLLVHHPGFVALTNRFKLQSAVLKAQLETRKHKDLYEVYNLQNGIQWLNYLNAEVNRAVQKREEAKAVAPRGDERAEFEKVFALIEGV